MSATSDAVLRPVIWNFNGKALAICGRHVAGNPALVAKHSSFMEFIATDPVGYVDRQLVVMTGDAFRNLYLRIAKAGCHCKYQPNEEACN